MYSFSWTTIISVKLSFLGKICMAIWNTQYVFGGGGGGPAAALQAGGRPRGRAGGPETPTYNYVKSVKAKLNILQYRYYTIF